VIYEGREKNNKCWKGSKKGSKTSQTRGGKTRKNRIRSLVSMEGEHGDGRGEGGGRRKDRNTISGEKKENMVAEKKKTIFVKQNHQGFVSSSHGH